jgi:hypothetical protein
MGVLRLLPPGVATAGQREQKRHDVHA